MSFEQMVDKYVKFIIIMAGILRMQCKFIIFVRDNGCVIFDINFKEKLNLQIGIE